MLLRMPARRRISPRVETLVATLSHRRCCLCVFLEGRDEVRKGQIAHLNGDCMDNRLENLAWLCLDHHDDYDSRTSQSKGLTEGELRHWRDQLLRKYEGPDATWTVQNATAEVRAETQQLRAGDSRMEGGPGAFRSGKSPVSLNCSHTPPEITPTGCA